MRRRRRRGVSAQDPGAPEEVARASTVRKFRAKLAGPIRFTLYDGNAGPQTKSSQSVQVYKKPVNLGFLVNSETRHRGSEQPKLGPPFLVNESETR